MLGRILSNVLGVLRGASITDAPTREANPLAAYFLHNPGRGIEKWHHYFEIYHRHLAAFRGRSPVVLEIGVYDGGSLEMWRHYFGPGAQIVGVDIDPRCKEFEGDAIRVIIGDQADRKFLASLRESLPRIDIVIDDGGHTMVQQIATFEELYAHVQPNGIYLCEDTHTSYLPHFGGGYGKSDSFIEYAKKLVDRMHGWYSVEPERFDVDSITRSTHAVHFYDSIVLLEKRPIKDPTASRTGRAPAWRTP